MVVSPAGGPARQIRGWHVRGRRHSVTSADGTSIGLLTAGTGPGLLLVHGGMGRLERWEPLWGPLTEHWQVTAMDRRGRGSSGDAEPYELSQEYDDVAAVAATVDLALNGAHGITGASLLHLDDQLRPGLRPDDSVGGQPAR